MNNKNENILIFKNSGEMSDFALKKWKEISRHAIKEKGFFAAALSGGHTPVTFYKKLAGLKNSLQWDKTHIFMVDERFVPYGDKDSSFSMINNTLIRHLDIPSENIHAITTEENTLQASAKNYEKDLISFFKTKPGKFPVFDFILLGIGEDGHTASLFPGTSSLREKRRLAITALPPDISKKIRITITMPVINNAHNIIFLVSGYNKAEVVKELLENGNTTLPAAKVKTKKGMIFYVLDQRAASQLSEIP